MDLSYGNKSIEFWNDTQDKELYHKRLKQALAFSIYLTLALIWCPRFGTLKVISMPESKPKAKVNHVVLKIKPLETKVVSSVKPERVKIPMPALVPLEPEPQIIETAKESVAEPLSEPLMETKEWSLEVPEEVPLPNEAIPDFTPGLEKPLILKRVAPRYPQMAARIGIQGYVILKATLRADGTIDQVEVVRGLSNSKFGFEKEAILALQQWEFQPGRLRGHPVDVSMALRIDFQIK